MNAEFSEIFYSLQLEGAQLGYPMIFVRFARCNLDCDFCDTKYSLVKGIIMDESQLLLKIKHFPSNKIVFTGGEPSLYDEFMCGFMKLNKQYDYFLETNGTIFPENSLNFFKHIVVSPKFFAVKQNILLNLNKYTQSIEFKFVVLDTKDIDKSIEMTMKLNLKSCTIQPISLNNEPLENYIKRSRSLIEYFKNNYGTKGCRFIMQNQKILYNNKRGM